MSKSTIPDSGLLNARELGVPRMLLLGVQHLFAMFGATVLVPALTGLSVSAALLFAGLGTLLFHLLTRGKVPAFLGSSFAFIGGYNAIRLIGNTAEGDPIYDNSLLPYACVGVACAGLLYLILAALVKIFGANKVMRFFPPIVTGPLIIAIGLTLSKSAVDNCSANWLIALAAILIVVACNIWGRGMIKIIPIMLGVLGSMGLAVLLHLTGAMQTLDPDKLTAFKDAAWIGLPVAGKNTVFSIFGSGLDTSLLITAIITIVPIALATMMEHIGDISAISSTTGKNFIADPGLHRTLLGDGLATIMASLFGGPANTTYGENTGVLNLSKVYDPRVVRIAAYFAVLLSFSPKFAALVSLMPTATIGGVSLVLYGMISAVGVRNILENNVNFKNSRNVIIAALILVLSIGISYSAAGSLSFTVGKVTVALTGLAVGALVGIILNAILPGKDYEFSRENAGELKKHSKLIKENKKEGTK